MSDSLSSMSALSSGMRGEVFSLQNSYWQLSVARGGCGHWLVANALVDGSTLIYIWTTPTGLRDYQQE